MNNLFYYTTSIRVAPGAKYEIPQTRSIPAAITLVINLIFSLSCSTMYNMFFLYANALCLMGRAIYELWLLYLSCVCVCVCVCVCMCVCPL